MIERIIKNNREIPSINLIILLIFILGLITFISGFIIGYIISQNIIYDKLLFLIDNQRILYFNNEYYVISKIYLNNTLLVD